MLNNLRESYVIEYNEYQVNFRHSLVLQLYVKLETAYAYASQYIETRASRSSTRLVVIVTEQVEPSFIRTQSKHQVRQYKVIIINE